MGLAARWWCLAATIWRLCHGAELAESNVTALGSVRVMLSEMHSKAVENKAAEDLRYTSISQNCTDTLNQTQELVDDLDLQLVARQATIDQLEVDIQGLTNRIGDSEAEVQRLTTDLEYEQTTRAAAKAAYTQDLAEYDAALSAITQAKQIMAQHSTSTFLQSQEHGSSVQESLKGVLTKVIALANQTPGYTTDSENAIFKDQSIFDDFNTLTTARTAYTSRAGGSVIQQLDGLHTDFTTQRTSLITTEGNAVTAFQSKESLLKKQISDEEESLVSDRDARSTKQTNLGLEQELLRQASHDRNSTSDYIKQLNETCQKKEEAYNQMSELLDQEIAALNKAIEFVTQLAGVPTQLLQADADAKPGTGAAPVAGLLKVKAQALHSQRLWRLVHEIKQLGKQVPITPTDQLEKVKTMIYNLISKLHQEQAKDLSTMAFCNTELAKNENVQADAKGQIDESTATIAQLESSLVLLTQEIENLGKTLNVTSTEREAWVEARATEKLDNEQKQSEAQDSAVAVQTAIDAMQEYFANVTKALGQSGAAPMMVEGSNAVAMLEVVRDQYLSFVKKVEKLEAEAAEDHKQLLLETDIQISAMTADRNNKEQTLADHTSKLHLARQDLNSSQTSLEDAEAVYENLKPTCMGSDTYEQRKAQLEGEIAALKDAEAMLEQFSSTGAAAAAAGFVQQATAAAASGGAAASLDALGATLAQQKDHDAADPAMVQEVVTLLEEISTEVAADLAADTQVYNDMEVWCESSLAETQAALDAQVAHDRELVTTIETSTAQKEQLDVELQHLRQDLAEEQASLEEQTTIRNNEVEQFNKNEKELTESIAALKAATLVLSSHYERVAAEDEKNYTQVREDLEAEKLRLRYNTTVLLKVAGDVARALKSLPAQEVGSAMAGSTVEQSLALQSFLNRPQELFQATLTQTGSSSAAADIPVTGQQVLGILSQLLTTFKADLEAAQQAAATSEQQYIDLKATKEQLIAAMSDSIVNKEAQFAHYSTILAQAKEDLQYLRAAHSEDWAYLLQVQDQCRASKYDFQQRNTTRHMELASLDEAIGMLKDAATASSAAAGAMMLHAVAPNTQHFVHHKLRQQRAAAAAVAAKLMAKPQTKHLPHSLAQEHTVSSSNSSSRAAPVKKLSFLRVARAQPPHEQARWTAQGRRAAFLATAAQALPKLATTPEHRAAGAKLAAFTMKVKLSKRAASASVTDDAIRTVVNHIDTVREEMRQEKALEVRMKDTCVSEKNQATQQLERRNSDKVRLETLQAQHNSTIQSSEADIETITNEIMQLNQTLVAAEAARQQEHVAFKGSVEKELKHQEVLLSAIAVLKQFYSKALSSIPATPVASAPAAASSLIRVPPSRAPPSRPSHPAAPLKSGAGRQAQPVKMAALRAVARGGPGGSKSVPTHVLVAQPTNKTPSDPYIAPRRDIVKANRTAGPGGFEKPLEKHGASKGVIGILELLVENSKHLIEEIVKAEQSSADMLVANVAATATAIEEKTRQLAVLKDAKAVAEEGLLDAEAQATQVETEIGNINAFITLIDSQCTTLLANFEQNQAARATEIHDLGETKAVLLGMVQG